MLVTISSNEVPPRVSGAKNGCRSTPSFLPKADTLQGETAENPTAGWSTSIPLVNFFAAVGG